MNGIRTQKDVNIGFILALGIVLVLVVLGIYQIRRWNTPSTSTTITTTVVKSTADQIQIWETEIEKLKWRADSAANTAKQKAAEGKMDEADKWANHAGSLSQQIEDLRRKIRDAVAKEKEGKDEDKQD